MTQLAEIMGVAPAASAQYAHGAGAQSRQFLYEQDPVAVIEVRLPAPSSPQIRALMESAVARINQLYYGFAHRQGALQIAPDVHAARSAVLALYALSPAIPAQIFPLPAGGLQIEWHHGDLDIEIECHAHGPYHIFVERAENTVVDEEASGRRAEQLFRQIQETLADVIGQSGNVAFLRRPF